MSVSSKMRRKIEALKALGISETLAKSTRLVRIKAKRVLLGGPRLLGALVVEETKMELILPQGVQISQENNKITIVLPKKVEKPKNNIDKKAD